jgi:polar amino acid transport system substrate-binding protein
MTRWLLACGLALLTGLVRGEAATVRYCDYPVYPPISWSDSTGKVQGMAPQAVREVIGNLGLQLQIVELGNWQRCLSDAAEGRVDLVIAYRTEARERDLLFSRVPLLREEVVLFYNRNRPLQVQGLQDLTQYRGGLLFGESYGKAFDQLVARAGNIERVASSQQNFGKLIRGRIDFIAHERRTGQLLIEFLPGAEQIAMLPLTLAVDHLHFAISRRSPLAARLAEVDAELQRLLDSGVAEQWLAQSAAAYRAAQQPVTAP